MGVEDKKVMGLGPPRRWETLKTHKEGEKRGYRTEQIMK